jgi:hypothetical protein
MNTSEPNKPGGNPDELPADTNGQTPDKNVYFPEFAKLEDEFNTADYQRPAPDWWLDLETSCMITKKIWKQESLMVRNWRQLSGLEALILAQFNGNLTIYLNDKMVPELQMNLCWVLSEHRGVLLLCGSISLTPEAATALLQHPGPVIIHLDNLDDFTVVNILKRHHFIKIF